MVNPISVDKYLIIAHEKGFVKISEKSVVVTETGKSEMDSITEHCMSLMGTLILQDFEKLSESLSEALGKPLTKIETFQTIMAQLLGTEARVLAFLLNEKDNNYANFTQAVEETLVNTAPNVTPFRKKPKYDA